MTYKEDSLLIKVSYFTSSKIQNSNHSLTMASEKESLKLQIQDLFDFELHKNNLNINN